MQPVGVNRDHVLYIFARISMTENKFSVAKCTDNVDLSITQLEILLNLILDLMKRKQQN